MWWRNMNQIDRSGSREDHLEQPAETSALDPIRSGIATGETDNAAPRNSEIALRVVSEPAGPRGWLSTVESASKIAAAVALPLLVAFFGAQVTKETETEKLKVEYVKLAVDVLKNPANDANGLQLKNWAVEVLNHLAVVKLPSELRDALKEGKVMLPSAAGSDELGIARNIESLVEQGKYKEASELFTSLRESHFSGVGYSAYPELAFAFDQLADVKDAIQVLDLLQARMEQDAQKNYGYLAPGQPPRDFLLRDFEKLLPSVKSPEVRTRIEQVMAKIREAPRKGSDELGVARYIESLVEQGKYKEASELFTELRESHFSGVGYSAYPELAFAFDQLTDVKDAMQVLELLQARMEEDARKGYGYLAPGRPPRGFLRRDFEKLLPSVKSPEVRARIEQMMAKL